MNIPLPDMLRSLRARQFEQDMPSGMSKWGLRAWAMLATRPALYRLGTAASNMALRMMARGRGKITSVPLAGGWTRTRDLPQPEACTFMQQYKNGRL